MKKFRLILSSFLIIALTSVLVYSQNGNSGLGDIIRDRTFHENGASTIQFTEFDKVPQVNQTVTSETKGLVAYGYSLFAAGGLPSGPCSFELDNPGLITSLAPGIVGNFISAGTWADGKWYGVEYSIGNLFEINPFDGSMTFIGSCGYNIGDLAWDGTTMYCCTGTAFGSLNLENAAATLIGYMGNSGYMIGMGCDSAGNIYGVDIYEDNLYSINKTTGAGTVIGPLGIDLDEYAQDMDYDKDNDVLYLSARVNSTGALYTINTSTGAATLVGGFMNNIKIDAFAIPYGVTVVPNDVGIVSIPSPSSGMFLTTEEPVVVLINNFGTNAQSDFDVSFTMDGGSPVTETITATINGGETYEYTFIATIDLSAITEYTIEVCTDLAGDENPENNCMTKTVVNTGLDYCDASTLNSDELISLVLCGSINNASYWQTAVADYTDISTTIEPGMSEDITLINSDPHVYDTAIVWVDWNNDTVFQLNSEEEFSLINDGTNEILSGSIEVPAGTVNGMYRMRVRLVRAVSVDPCGQSTWGEIEDYTIVVDDVATYIDKNLLNNILVYPNPASDIVNIKSDDPIKYISVFNQTGQEVFSVELNSSFYRFNTSGFKSGIYFFLIKTDESAVSRRIVIN
ncbi:MAG: T9SS type A sorting domain-containing protein [Bacteroidales bacterium]|nr:T9SS type A sorting domain-containing protein [Bacteroidales bacterium]